MEEGTSSSPTLDLPTPPFPLATTMTFLTPGILDFFGNRMRGSVGGAGRFVGRPWERERESEAGTLGELELEEMERERGGRTRGFEWDRTSEVKEMYLLLVWMVRERIGRGKGGIAGDGGWERNVSFSRRIFPFLLSLLPSPPPASPWLTSSRYLSSYSSSLAQGLLNLSAPGDAASSTRMKPSPRSPSLLALRLPSSSSPSA